ncbi:MAG: hypothetical protein VZR35_08055 [Lachnospiraceae bacterium]|jgi:hypothetical protein|nr:hypothetical protein [Lachnospiraceae bacterium]MBR7015134.1 hypothetical protein [Lachnospiraceae bacterium]MEE3378414.1 hypothetical protein [Lachnospiraceae bacterium]MEE3457561.1 hypothetical protein [Lachnospiraceae bacterium]
METKEKRDMRAGRAADEILYVVMCVLFSFFIIAAVFAMLILPEQAELIRRVIFMFGTCLNILVAVRFFTHALKLRGWIFAAAAAVCVVLIFI